MGWLLFNYKPWFKREGLPNHWQSLFKKLWVLHSNIHVKCPFSFPQCAILDILERLLWWVLGHEKFCYHPLLLLKICPLLWATLLSMHCSCMLMEERSIHRLILQYFDLLITKKIEMNFYSIMRSILHLGKNGSNFR